ncbi:MAG: SRPBCC domain-containing protein [Ignavibacteriaceae bacterium]
MKEKIKITETFHVSAKTLYDAWISSEEHSKFTGEKAKIDPVPGGKFTAGNGYITGATTSLQPFSRIVQSWRTKDFPEGIANSKLEVYFEKVEKGTLLTIVHSEIPDGQGKEYENGWKEFYFKPMKEYFKNKN